MKVSILGGGVAGLSCGIALRQRGIEVDIFERTASPTTMGAGVVLWPNATLVLDRLGLLPSIKARSGAPTRMRRIASSGAELGQLDIEIINKEIGSSSLSISRRSLIDVLLLAFRDAGGHVHFNQQVEEIQPKTETETAGTRIRFQSGLVITPEIVIGAEGRMKSPSRKYVLGNNKPIFQKFINWVGLFEGERNEIDDKVIFDFWGIGARFGVVPLSSKSAYWAAGITADAIGANEPEWYLDELSATFDHWPEPIRRLIHGTPTQHISKIYVHDHDPIETWHKDNLILVGDAAHAPLPTSGQGACQAIEDAWHIAGALSKNGDRPQEAFENFTNNRRTRTANITLAGRQFAKTVFNDDPQFCHARDEASRSTDFENLSNQMASGWKEPFGKHADRRRPYSK